MPFALQTDSFLRNLFPHVAVICLHLLLVNNRLTSHNVGDITNLQKLLTQCQLLQSDLHVLHAVITPASTVLVLWLDAQHIHVLYSILPHLCTKKNEMHLKFWQDPLSHSHSERSLKFKVQLSVMKHKEHMINTYLSYMSKALNAWHINESRMFLKVECYRYIISWDHVWPKWWQG